MAARIPMRPADKAACEGLNEEQMNGLSYYVLSGCTKDYAYEHFMVPGYSVTRAALARLSSQFFGGKPAKEYIKSYRMTLENFMERESTRDDEKAAENEKETAAGASGGEEAGASRPDSISKSKARAVQKIIAYVLDEAEHIKDAEDPEMLVKIADKVGLFDEFEKEAEAPRRYLPLDRCGDCRYYRFCTSDEVIDECALCRYKEYAEADGVRYDYKTMLKKSENNSE